MQDLEDAKAAQILPATGWRKRLTDGEPHGICESFLSCQEVIYDRIDQPEGIYSLEAPLHPVKTSPTYRTTTASPDQFSIPINAPCRKTENQAGR